MSVSVTSNDPLLGGFYTIKEAARLLRIDNRQRIYKWLRPSAQSAVISRDDESLENRQELSEKPPPALNEKSIFPSPLIAVTVATGVTELSIPAFSVVVYSS